MVGLSFDELRMTDRVGGFGELDVSRKGVDCRVVPPRHDGGDFDGGFVLRQAQDERSVEEFTNWTCLVNGQLTASFLLTMMEGFWK